MEEPGPKNDPKAVRLWEVDLPVPAPILSSLSLQSLALRRAKPLEVTFAEHLPSLSTLSDSSAFRHNGGQTRSRLSTR